MRVDKTEWQLKSFDDVCIIKNGKDHKGVNSPQGKYPIYGSGGKIGYAIEYLCNPGTTIIGRKGTINSPIFVNEKIWNIDTAFGLEPKPCVIPKFFFYACLHFDFRKIQSGAAIPSLTQKDIKKQPFAIPPIEEQQEIVAELDALQDMIDDYKAQIADLDALAQSIFLDMFGDPVANPKGWEMHAISSFGKIVTGNTPPKAIKEYYDTNYIEWIKTDNIQKNNLHPTLASEYLSEKGSLKGRVVSENSILICCIAGSLNSIGRCCITNRRVAFNQQINAIECNNQHNFLYSYWLIKCAQKKFIEAASTGMKHILSKSVMSSIKIPVPPIPLQQHFATQVEAIEKQKELIRQQLADAETLMAERMQYYFS